jgi:hypothetical protein
MSADYRPHCPDDGMACQPWPGQVRPPAKSQRGLDSNKPFLPRATRWRPARNQPKEPTLADSREKVAFPEAGGVCSKIQSPYY